MRRHRPLPLLCLVALASFFVVQEAAAQETDARATELAAEGEEYWNAIDVLIGATTETDPAATSFTVGLGYVRRLSSRFSVGVAGELATSETFREALLFAVGFVQPVGALALGTGPGYQWDREKGEEPGGAERSSAFVWRFSGAWEFELGRYTISPELNLDLTEGEVVWVYGLAFGVMF